MAYAYAARVMLAFEFVIGAIVFVVLGYWCRFFLGVSGTTYQKRPERWIIFHSFKTLAAPKDASEPRTTMSRTDGHIETESSFRRLGI